MKSMLFSNPSEIVLNLVKDETIDLPVLRSHQESHLERMLVDGSNDEIIRAIALLDISGKAGAICCGVKEVCLFDQILEDN